MLKEFLIKVKNKYVTTFNKTLDFKSRASRFEYWSFSLVNFFASIFFAALDLNFFVILLFLLTFIPSISVTIRRLHDTNRSGWYMLFYLLPFVGPLFLLALMFLRSDLKINDYGLPDEDVLKSYKIPFLLNNEGKAQFDFGFAINNKNLSQEKKVDLEKTENS